MGGALSFNVVNVMNVMNVVNVVHSIDLQDLLRCKRILVSGFLQRNKPQPFKVTINQIHI